jgi:plastocyanin domain-containing protein
VKTKIIWMLAALVVAGGLWLALTTKPPAPAAPGPGESAAAVSAGDKQVVEINVKEGYQPRAVTAKAGVPLLLKMKTQGTFDCSATFSIPSLGVRERLEPTGEKTIEIPAQKAGETLTGVCGMGMFSLVIKFT